MADHQRKRRINEARGFTVVKANDLIQKSRFNLSLEEQKILLYLISKIKPDDIAMVQYVFSVKDFCEVCGLDEKNGGNYNYIKQTLKGLRDKSVWVRLNEKEEATLAWLDYVIVNEQSGDVKIKINDIMRPYLLELKEQFTQYELVYTLAMKSRYSIRLYELLKSYEYRNGHTFRIEDLKTRLNAEHYKRYQDFDRNAMGIAVREINALTDIKVGISVIQEGRRYAKIKFSVSPKTDLDQRVETFKQIELVLDGDQSSKKGKSSQNGK
jgi:plasmid replication initiation protein